MATEIIDGAGVEYEITLPVGGSITNAQVSKVVEKGARIQLIDMKVLNLIPGRIMLSEADGAVSIVSLDRVRLRVSLPILEASTG